MKRWWSTYGKISAALLAIFGMGYALGNVSCRRHQMPDLTTSASGPTWTKETIERLTQQLQLSADQQAKIGPTVSAMEKEVMMEKEAALFKASAKLYQLHDQIAPHLNAQQQAELKVSKEKMNAWMKHRFSQFFREKGLE